MNEMAVRWKWVRGRRGGGRRKRCTRHGENGRDVSTALRHEIGGDNDGTEVG